jgi:hypothetical protein
MIGDVFQVVNAGTHPILCQVNGSTILYGNGVQLFLDNLYNNYVEGN